MNIRLKKVIQHISLIIILYGCASQAVPTGGEKDILPPEVVQTIPKNASTNYQGKTIEIFFDEIVSVENIKQELLITPRPEGNYEYEVKKNRLSLNFDEAFAANTTYTFNFRKAIKDITEKNIAENTKLVFSTGHVIDSLYIKGDVKDILTNKPIEEALILLYRVNDTLNINKHAPYYLTKTNKEGHYTIENLKQDMYNIYALSEKNNNQKYDQEKEKIGFTSSPINLENSIDTLDFKISIIDTIQPKIVRARPEANCYQIDFNEGLININLKSGQIPSQIYFQLNESNKVKIYNTINKYDSIPLQVIAEDSVGNILQNNINIKFNEVAPNKDKTPEKLSIMTEPKEGEKIESNFIYKVYFSKPISDYDFNKISLLADTISAIELKPEEINWDNTFTQLIINKKINVKKNLRISIPMGTFLTVEGDTSSKIVTTHELKDPEDYGTISGTIKTEEESFIVQLINSEYKVVAQQRNIHDYKFDYLSAGKYYLRVIIDNNTNGKWDQGNFQKRILPEAIIFLNNELTLKENWVLTGNNIAF